jgi:GT2 family glycosyltransferase
MRKYSEKEPLVLLSIVTWNHANTIGATIKSIIHQTYNKFQLVIFDNNSSDATVGIIESFRDLLSITLIKSRENTGFCGGHNHVLKNADYDYVLLVNPDIIMKPDYIEKTLEAFSIDQKIGAVCGLLVQSFEENPVVDSTGMMLTRSRRFTLINHGSRLNEIEIQSGFVAGLDGALPAFRREAVEHVSLNGNFFNHLFFAHKEDWDVSWRLLLFGWKTYFNKTSIAMHPRHFRPNDLKNRMLMNSKIKFDAFKNQLLLLMINEDRTGFIRDFFTIVPRLVATSLFCLFFERKSLRAFAYVFGNRKEITGFRKMVQTKRTISSSAFRQYLTWAAPVSDSMFLNKEEKFAIE